MCSFDCVCVIGIVNTKLLSSDKIVMQRRTKPHIKMTTAYAIRCVHKYIMLRTTQYWIHTRWLLMRHIESRITLHNAKYPLVPTLHTPYSTPNCRIGRARVRIQPAKCVALLFELRTKGKTGTRHGTHRKWLNKTHSPIIIFYFSLLRFVSSFRFAHVHGLIASCHCHIILNSASAHNGSQRLVGFHQQYGGSINILIRIYSGFRHDVPFGKVSGNENRKSVRC